MLMLGLAVGGYGGFWTAKLLTSNDVQLLALERQIDRLQTQIDTSEIMIEGSADILARYLRQNEQLTTEIQEMRDLVNRLRTENSALNAALADADTPASANTR